MKIKMKIPILVSLLLVLVPLATSQSSVQNILECLKSQDSQTPIPVYTSNNVNYTSLLQFTIANIRFLSSDTPKPILIITPLLESHVQASVICAKKHGILMKIRSGGHDYEGLSFISDVPFLILDLFKLRSVSIDLKEGTALVQSGATLGELYYSIAAKSKVLGFPGGVCPTVGIGGYFSGGGYGNMLRKYGLAADNVLDARIVDVNGRILDKASMGEDLFWAIRGGSAGGSFGVILSWKIKLVPVPPIVTVFRVRRAITQGATQLVYRWQEVAHKLPNELFIRAVLNVGQDPTQKGKKTVSASFPSMFLGKIDDLLIVMKEKFPEMGIERKDCIEMSWIQSVLHYNNIPYQSPLEVLLNRTQPKRYGKLKSDYIQEPISQIGLEGLWRVLLEEKRPAMTLNPYGGRMSEISESEIPFPHRNGNIYKIQYLVAWEAGESVEETQKHINWLRKLYQYMEPFASKSPRGAYINYRDIDIGQSKNGTANYLQSKAWGSKYFKNNYERLVNVKSKVDPENFFRNEQSIPTRS